MQVYADLLASRAKKRQQLLLATSVSVGKHSKSSLIDGGPLEDEDEDANGPAMRGANGSLAAAASDASAAAAERQADLFMDLPGKAAKRRRTGDAADNGMVGQQQT